MILKEKRSKMRVTNIDKEGLKHHWDLESVSTALPSDLSVCPSILFFHDVGKNFLQGRVTGTKQINVNRVKNKGNFFINVQCFAVC